MRSRGKPFLGGSSAFLQMLMETHLPHCCDYPGGPVGGGIPSKASVSKSGASLAWRGSSGSKEGPSSKPFSGLMKALCQDTDFTCLKTDRLSGKLLSWGPRALATVVIHVGSGSIQGHFRSDLKLLEGTPAAGCGGRHL